MTRVATLPWQHLQAMKTGRRPVPSPRVPRIGKWLPEDHALLHQWVGNLIRRIESRCRDQVPPFHPVIQEFQDLIEGDPVIYMLFNQMFHQIPNKPPYDTDPTGKPQVRNYLQMLQCFNEIMTSAPIYQKETGLVGFPITAILDWPMGTPSGFAAFLNDKVNAQMGRMLNTWGEFLKSHESTYVLSTDPKSGWFSADAMAQDQMKDFDSTYICEPNEPFHGFTSWDHFFTREFQEGARPIEGADDDNVIVNACESGPYNLQKNVGERDSFWIKGQPYSISHMLAKDPEYPKFVGGTVYQAFLSALCYHRWHSPVSGTVVKAYGVPGTYYSESRMAGFDPEAPNQSQGYITEVATRALIFIQSDNPEIGLMCFMAVGMAEASTCEIQVKAGDKLTKGQQLGMFHFGGSTHCLVFRKGVNLIFQLPEAPGLNASVLPVNSAIAILKPATPDE
jgi:phosphatidylserine decarboxylase